MESIKFVADNGQISEYFQAPAEGLKFPRFAVQADEACVSSVSESLCAVMGAGGRSGMKESTERRRGGRRVGEKASESKSNCHVGSTR